VAGEHRIKLVRGHGFPSLFLSLGIGFPNKGGQIRTPKKQEQLPGFENSQVFAKIFHIYFNLTD
jgi:hypothetical protein